MEGAPDSTARPPLDADRARSDVTVLGCSPTLIRALLQHGDAGRATSRRSARSSRPASRGTRSRTAGSSSRWAAAAARSSTAPAAPRSARAFSRPRPRPRSRPARSAAPRSGWPWTSSTRTGSPVRGEVGELVCRKPFPGMTRGFWGDPERYLDTYWRRLPGDLGARRLGVCRRGRLLVPARALGRHAQHRRQAHRARRDRVGRGRPSGGDGGRSRRHPARGQGRGRLGLLRRSARAWRRPTSSRPRSGTRPPPSSARRSGPIASCSCRRCRRPGARRSSAGRFVPGRWARIPAISRRSRIRSRSTTSHER